MRRKCLLWQMVAPLRMLPSWQDAKAAMRWPNACARFNAQGLPALETCHGGGPPFRYTSIECERILREFRRPPDRRLDGTATWSLVTLQRALRRAPDGLPHVSTHTIGCALHEAGYTWQKDRTWCNTGKALRVRKSGTVEVTDPDACAKKNSSSRHTP
jgi:transposase